MTIAEAAEAHTWRTRDVKKRLWPLKHQKDYSPALHTINTSPMLPHQRRELATGNNFTFSNPTSREGSNNSRNHSDDMEYDTWAERIKGQCNHFGKPNDAKLGAWTRRVPRKDNPDEDEFRWLVSSPVGNHGYYNDRESRFSHISHSAGAQTIAKYRQEMLDLVRGTPETAYELSLRDIVESPKITTPLQETVEDKSEEVKDENENENENEKKKKKKKKKKAGGLLLKMFIPKIPSVLGGRKSTGSSPSAKVSPRPMSGDGEKSGSEKSTDREWRSAEFGQMTAGGGSSNSSNSSGRRRRSSSSRKLRGCCPFFQTC